jgi:hypothetical protein
MTADPSPMSVPFDDAARAFDRMVETAGARRTEHMSHLTDGKWHDECSYCLRRRVHGGTGLEASPEGSQQS